MHRVYIEHALLLQCKFSCCNNVYSNTDHLRSEFVKRRLAEVQQLYRNIPSILHFTFSTVAMDQIGVAASQTLPKGVHVIRTCFL